MPGIVIKTDPNEVDGYVDSECSETVFVNGQPIALVGSVITEHEPWEPEEEHEPHKHARITTGSNSVFIEGKAVAIDGSECDCGHTVRATGSDVFLGD